MAKLQLSIISLLKEQPETLSSLARKLNRHPEAVRKALRRLAQTGPIRKHTIQVEWLGGYTTPVTLYYHPESQGLLPPASPTTNSKPTKPDALPCLAEAYNRQRETMTMLKHLRNPERLPNQSASTTQHHEGKAPQEP